MAFSTAASLAPFGTTIFTTMTRLAQEHGAVNLSQGFPDFDGPEFVKEAAIKAIRDGCNQYAPMPGVMVLRQAIAEKFGGAAGLEVNPETEVTVTSGCTEAIAAAMLGVCNPGDEVILFEPFYDSYRACVAMAGAVARVVTLRPPGVEAVMGGTGAGGAMAGAGASRRFTFDEGELRRACTGRTRAILVNTPHNPTGKVFTRAELEMIARLCVERDLIAITDEVYERLTFEEGTPHVSLAGLPGMRERTITLSSLGKTFSLTGWKIGWAVAPADLSKAVRAAHQFLTFATSTPMQHAAAVGIAQGEAYVASLLAQYRESRDFLGSALAGLGFAVFPSEGTYFLMADHSGVRVEGRAFADDVAFCTYLTTKVGVAAIPPSAFYQNAERGRTLVRFAFCKKRETLEGAVGRLQKLRAVGGSA